MKEDVHKKPPKISCLKSIFFIFLFFIACIIIFGSVAYLTHINDKKREKKYDQKYYEKFNKENFYFSGKVIFKKHIAHGGGFICLKKITTNKPAGYVFEVEGNFIASVGENTVKYIGSISKGNILGKTDRIKLGDSVLYNVGLDGKIRIFRNNELRFVMEAYCWKVYFNHRYTEIHCEEYLP